MLASQAIIQCLKNEGVDVVFGYPGAAICPFYDALKGSDIKHVLVRTEQCAGHAASGYAKASGKTGVCIATSGPGATNLITGIATAYMDSIPIVAITGQVKSSLIGRDAFQEADIVGATEPFTKRNYLVKEASLLPKIIKEAFYIASTGRPGPVLIDIPVDVQLEDIEFSYPQSVNLRGYKVPSMPHDSIIKRIADELKKSTRPVICAGGGVISAGAVDELMVFAAKNNIPVTTSLMGLGVIETDSELNMGMVGTHGRYTANYALNHCDVLVIVGARVGDRAMGMSGKISQTATVIHIDIDPAEIGKNIETHIEATGHAKMVIQALLNEDCKTSSDEWLQKLKKMKLEKDNVEYKLSDDTINPGYFVSKLSLKTPKNTVVTTEVGQNQFWGARHFKISKEGVYITSGGMGTMGYGLPASVGAKFGRPDSTVLVIAGDGSFQMVMQELGTIIQEDLDIKIILFNNSGLGMVRELQWKNYCGRLSAVELEKNPDFVKLAQAYGIESMSICKNSDIDMAIDKMLSHKGPFLLECKVCPREATL